MAIELDELVVRDEKAFRAWLSRNHAGSPGVWLVLHKQGGRVTELTYAQALEEALCFGWIDGQIAKRDGGSYRTRFTPRRAKSLWSARNVGLVDKLEREGRMTPAGRAPVEAAKADGRWAKAYAGAAKAQVPRDLLQALAKNDRARDAFEKLSSANRFSIIYRLNALKRAESRERKVREVVEQLSRGETRHPQKRRVKSS